MTKAPSPPITPEALTKERKLRWLHVSEAISNIRHTMEEKKLPRDQYKRIRISDAGPDSLHDFAMSTGLDFEEAIADYECGQMGKWTACHGECENLLNCEQNLAEALLQTWGARLLDATDLVILYTPKSVRCFTRKRAIASQPEPPAYSAGEKSV